MTTNLQIPKMVGLSWNVSAEGQARNKQRKYLRRIDEAYKPRIVCDAEFFRKRKIRSVGTCKGILSMNDYAIGLRVNIPV